MKFFVPLLILLSSFFYVNAQQAKISDPEFPKEYIMHVKLHNGMVTDFNGETPDQYTGGIQLVPQYTFVPHLLRGGVILDAYYTGKKLQAAVGPTLSIKLLTLRAKPFGSLGNLHLNIDHLWGSEHQQLLGGGINADIGNWIVIAFTGHRDYNLNTWWLQNSIAIRISKVKRKKQEF